MTMHRKSSVRSRLLSLALVVALCPAAALAQTAVRVPGFLPSTSGFHFTNSFRQTPDLVVNVLGWPVSVPAAGGGMCGGMAFAARDYHDAGLPIPATTMPPDRGPLLDYLGQRLVDSFDLPRGAWRYAQLMDPGISGERRWSAMIDEEWPRVRADLDAGRLSPLGLIRVESNDLGRIGDNHQVLAYGYDLAGDLVTIYLYDPNHPDQDDVAITLAPPGTVAQSTGEPLFSFFRSEYTFSVPPSSEPR
jgi:hypothetical protein